MNKNPGKLGLTEARMASRRFRVLDCPETKPLNGSAPKLQLEAITTRKGFARLAGEWDTFLAKTQTPSPFISWDYLDVWWDIYGGKGFTPRLYIARDPQGMLIGAAPLMISQKGSFAGARSNFRHLSLMGGLAGSAGESLELPARRGYEIALGEATADLILDSFSGQWDVLYLCLVPHDSRSTNAMIRRLSQAGVAIKTVSSTASPILPITASWADHIQTRTSNEREELDRVFSDAINTHDLELLRVGKEIPLEVAYEQTIRLSSLHGENGQNRIFQTSEMVDFHWKLAPRLLERGRLFFGLVKMDGQFAGAVYDLIDNQKMWTYQTIWDPRFNGSNVELLLNTWSDMEAHDLGLCEIDHLSGQSSVRGDQARYTRTLNIYEATRPRSMGGVLFSFACGIDRLLQKKATPLPSDPLVQRPR